MLKAIFSGVLCTIMAIATGYCLSSLAHLFGIGQGNSLGAVVRLMLSVVYGFSLIASVYGTHWSCKNREKGHEYYFMIFVLFSFAAVLTQPFVNRLFFTIGGGADLKLLAFQAVPSFIVCLMYHNQWYFIDQ